jgi:hypothetical protein
MKKLLTICLLLALSGFVISCRHKAPVRQTPPVQIEPVKISDYGRALFALDPMNLKPGLDSLSGKYSIFIGENPDTLNIIQIRNFIMDPFNKSLAEKYNTEYPDLAFVEKDLTTLFGNVKGIDPQFNVPEVYAYVSGLLYESPVQYFDSVMLIGMDMFLGWDCRQYREAGLPVYMTRRMQRQNIVPECARQLAISMIPADLEPKTLLDYMIMHGKVLYAMDRFLPTTPDSLKIGYTSSQFDWISGNEASVWRLFIDQQILYKTDGFINNRFIQDGPFTSGLPEGSPAMLGRWIGWQIVKSYMKKHPETSPGQLFKIGDAQQILSQSGYKPKK